MKPYTKLVTEKWLKERCEDDGGCLIWQRGLDSHGNPLGHGGSTANGKRVKFPVRRAVWEMRNGPAPDHMKVVNTCTNPRCVTCVELVTIGEQNRRTWADASNKAKMTLILREVNRKRTKIDMEAARRIRNSDAPLWKSAQEAGISMQRAWQIRVGLGWREDRNPFAGLGA